jgi:glycosyltransferase involved in cell wall biosynthesis
MSSPLISCIVPVFNDERYLAEALDSMLAQTYKNLQVIVVDDASTDGTAAVAARYGESILYLRQDKAGAPAARNLGLRSARGDFIAFLDSDDLWRAEKLQRQMARFEARPELDVCLTHLKNFWIPELKEEEERFKGHRLAQALPGYVTQTLLARRKSFDIVGPFNESMPVGDPTDWFLRAAERGLVMETLPDVLVYRRMHQRNMSMQAGTRSMTPVMQEAILRVFKASLERRRTAK